MPKPNLLRQIVTSVVLTIAHMGAGPGDSAEVRLQKAIPSSVLAVTSMKFFTTPTKHQDRYRMLPWEQCRMASAELRVVTPLT